MSKQSTNRAFDDLARALAEGSISRRRALKLFVGTAIAALIPSRALARQQKVTICHKPGTPDEQTKEVPNSAVDGHLGHGDRLGRCETTTSTTTAAPTTSTSTTTPTTSTSTSTTSTSTTTPMCLPFGSSCTDDIQCCTSICTTSPLGPGFRCSTCRPVGESCTEATASQCCSGFCENETCCVITGGCTTDEDCCGFMICSIDGICGA